MCFASVSTAECFCCKQNLCAKIGVHFIWHGVTNLTSKFLCLQKFQDPLRALLISFGLVSGGFDTSLVCASNVPLAAGILSVVGVFAFAWVRTLTLVPFEELHM